MKTSDARKIKGLKDLPRNAPVFAYVPGRYYVGKCFIEMPQSPVFPKGGDVTAMLWRYENTPEEWVLTYRFRYYSGPKVWNSEDRKSWYAVVMTGDEQKAERNFRLFAKTISALAGVTLGKKPEIHWLIVKGGVEKLFAEIKRQKPFWLHLKVADEPEEGDGIG